LTDIFNVVNLYQDQISYLIYPAQELSLESGGLFRENRELLNSIQFSGSSIDFSSPHFVDEYNPIGHIRGFFSQFFFLAVKFSRETTDFNFIHEM
jgi:hypothetical protein